MSSAFLKRAVWYTGKSCGRRGRGKLALSWIMRHVFTVSYCNVYLIEEGVNFFKSFQGDSILFWA